MRTHTHSHGRQHTCSKFVRAYVLGTRRALGFSTVENTLPAVQFSAHFTPTVRTAHAHRWRVFMLRCLRPLQYGMAFVVLFECVLGAVNSKTHSAACKLRETNSKTSVYSSQRILLAEHSRLKHKTRTHAQLTPTSRWPTQIPPLVQIVRVHTHALRQ